MISETEALEIHQILIERFGGSTGVRDRNLLNSAISRPYQTFDGEELYPKVIDKAVANIESIIKNHPFTDGNKRMGYVLARLLILEENMDIQASQNEKYQFVHAISKSELSFDEIRSWLDENTK